MNPAIVQRRIVEVARERGFTEKHIAVMSFEIGQSITLGDLSDRQMETLLDAIKREKPEAESVRAENLIDVMCRCHDGVYRHSPVSVRTPLEEHKGTCAFRRVIELTDEGFYS